MKCYRLIESEYCNPIDLFSGKGAANGGGRWNRDGVPVCYAGESPEVAFVEKGYHRFIVPLALAQDEATRSQRPHNFFLESLRRIQLKLATLAIPDAVKMLDLTDPQVWSEIAKNASIAHPFESSRKSNYDSIPGHWTQELSHYISTNEDVIGFKARSARHSEGKTVMLFSEKLSGIGVSLESVEDVTIAPSGVGSVANMKNRRHFELEVAYLGEILKLEVQSVE